MQPIATPPKYRFAQRMVGLAIFLTICCVPPYSCLTGKPPEWSDLDNVRVGMTLQQVQEAYPHELTVRPEFDQMPKFEEYLRTSGKSLKSFNGLLRRRDGMGLAVNSGAIAKVYVSYDVYGNPTIPDDPTIIGKNSLDYVRKSGQDWRVSAYGEFHLSLRDYLRLEREAKEGFTGELECSAYTVQPSVSGYYMTIHVKNGRVTSTERDVIYD